MPAVPMADLEVCKDQHVMTYRFIEPTFVDNLHRWAVIDDPDAIEHYKLTLKRAADMWHRESLRSSYSGRRIATDIAIEARGRTWTEQRTILVLFDEVPIPQIHTRSTTL